MHNKQQQKHITMSQIEANNTEQSQQQQQVEQKQRNSQITIDKEMIKCKQKLLSSFYQLSEDETRINLIKKWPNPTLQNAITNMDIIHKTNNAWYFGESSNQMFHGYGLLIYEQIIVNQNQNRNNNPNYNSKNHIFNVGRFYEGQFQNNCKHGYGLQYIAGDIYIGKFVNNKPEDTNSVFFWKNGDFYIGSFINGMKHGHGRWQSGSDYYEGVWKLNRPEGWGKIHTAVSDYEGDVKNGYKHGRGIQIFSNGDRYEGLYANGKPEGDGTYIWKNGAVYKGQFKNGIRYGYGNWTYGSQSYEGDYINDKRNGQGLYKWGGSSYYKGQFMDDLRHGVGQMHWNQNSYYKGQWKEGMQSGKGQIWQEGKLSSKGIFQDGKLIKQPNKLQKSNVTNNSESKNWSTPGHKNQHGHQHTLNHMRYHHQHTKSNKSEQKAAIRYPVIQRKQKTRNSFHNPNDLSKIEQFPYPNKNKKYQVSTSFSNNGKFSGNTTMNQILNPKHPRFIKQAEEDPHYHISTRKKQYILSQCPAKLPESKQRFSHTSSKKINYQKKKIYAVNKTVSKSVGMSEIAEIQLEPIKWKNFTHMKNNPSQTNNSLHHN